MSVLQKWIIRACTELNLTNDVEYSVHLDNKSTLRVMIRIANLGASDGMLVDSSFKIFEGHLQELSSKGFGFSVLDEPKNTEEFDLISFKEMFCDWGWSGKLEEKPDWMSEDF